MDSDSDVVRDCSGAATKGEPNACGVRQDS